MSNGPETSRFESDTVVHPEKSFEISKNCSIRNPATVVQSENAFESGDNWESNMDRRPRARRFEQAVILELLDLESNSGGTAGERILVSLIA